MLTGEDVNMILSVVFSTKLVAKKLRIGVSLIKVLNPQPIASVVLHTGSTVIETLVIHIQDELEPETLQSTIITEHPPPPPQPQSPTPKTTSPPQPTDPKLMQFDPPEQAEREFPKTTHEFPEPRPKVFGPNPRVPEQSLQLTGPNQDTQDQLIVPFVLEKDTQTVEDPQAQSTQHIPSMAKVEGGQGSEKQGASASKREEIPEVQKEPESTSGKSTTSA
jgi:hypothetical protein